jgi:hypothetical protein
VVVLLELLKIERISVDFVAAPAQVAKTPG